MTRIWRDNWIVLGILAVIAGVPVVVCLPQDRKLETLRGEIASRRRSQESDAKMALTVPAMVNRVEAMKRRYRNFDRRLPRRIELGGFLREISANLSQEDLFSQAIEPGNPESQALFHTLPITMKFHGSYLSLVSFLQRIGRMQRLTRVRSLKIDREDDGDALKFELQLNIYFTES